MAKRTKDQRKKDRQNKRLKKKFKRGIELSGKAPDALDASSSFDPSSVEAPTQNYNQKFLSQAAKDENRTQATNYVDLGGKVHSNRQDYKKGNLAALDLTNEGSRRELENPDNVDGGDKKFVGSDMLVGAFQDEYDSSDPGPLRRQDQARGAGLTLRKTDDKTFSDYKVGERVRGGAGIDLSSATDTYKMSERNLARQFSKGDSEKNRATYGFGLRKGEKGEGFVHIGGVTEGVTEAGFQALSDARNPKLSKYSPVETKNLLARSYSPTRNDTKTTNVNGNTIYATGKQSGINKVTRVASQYGNRDSYKKDNFSELSVKEVSKNLKAGRTLQARGNRNHRIKAEKIKGAVDLDMSGSVDTRLERNAKAFVGVDNIYGKRKDARKEIKAVKKGYTPKAGKSAIKGRQFEYSQNGNTISEEKFKRARNSNITKFNQKQRDYQTAQVNAGVGGKTLTGKNSYASMMGVNKDKAFGNVSRSTLSKKETSANVNQKQYKKLQKRMNSKILSKFYKS